MSPTHAHTPRRLRITLAVLLAAGCIATIAAPNPAAAAPRLFTAASLPAAADQSHARAEVMRRRGVRLDLRDFAGAPASADAAVGASPELELNLFADVTLVAARDAVEQSAGAAMIWKGHVPKAAKSEVTLVMRDGILIGNVRADGRQYAIRYVGDGLHAVEEIAPKAFPACGACQAPGRLTPAEQASVLSDAAAAAPDDGSTIDIMVVYTANARATAGGTVAMQNHIALAMAEANTGFGNSGAVQRFNLVHTAELAGNSSGDFNIDLDRLTNTSDGYWDNVHTLRDTYAADAVSLFTNTTQYCGIGWIMQTPSSGFQSYAFNVVYWGCATGNYSFAHEFGHNFGCAHDRDNAGVSGSYTYSYGWQNPTVNRTIMAYNTGCNCPRVNYWSNPTVIVDGWGMGDYAVGTTRGAHNSLTLDNNRSVVANWRQSAATEPTISWVTPPPATAAGRQPLTVSWRLADFAGPITNNQAHFGVDYILGSSPVKAAANGTYSHTFTAPNIGTYNSPKTYRYVALARDNGTQVLSPFASTLVSAGAAPPTVTWVSPPPATITGAPGMLFYVSWKLSNFQNPPTKNVIAWGVTGVEGETFHLPGGNGIYQLIVSTPDVSVTTTKFYTAYADNGIEFALAAIVPVIFTP